MEKAHMLTITVSAVAALAFAGIWQTLPDDQAIMAKLNTVNQKINDNTTRLTDEVSELEQRLNVRANLPEAQTTQLTSAKQRIAMEHINDDIINTQNELERLKQEMAQLKNSHKLVSSEPLTPIPSPEQIDTQANSQQRAQVQLLEDTLITETSDPDWSIAAEEQVRSGLVKASGELAVDNLVCATTMCKLEATSTSNDPAEIFRDMDEKLAWEGEIFMTVDLDEGRTTAWLGRPGESLPRADYSANSITTGVRHGSPP